METMMETTTETISVEPMPAEPATLLAIDTSNDPLSTIFMRDIDWKSIPYRVSLDTETVEGLTILVARQTGVLQLPAWLP